MVPAKVVAAADQAATARAVVENRATGRNGSSSVPLLLPLLLPLPNQSPRRKSPGPSPTRSSPAASRTCVSVIA